MTGETIIKGREVGIGGEAEDGWRSVGDRRSVK